MKCFCRNECHIQFLSAQQPIFMTIKQRTYSFINVYLVLVQHFSMGLANNTLVQGKRKIVAKDMGHYPRVEKYKIKVEKTDLK